MYDMYTTKKKSSVVHFKRDYFQENGRRLSAVVCRKSGIQLVEMRAPSMYTATGTSKLHQDRPGLEDWARRSYCRASLLPDFLTRQTQGERTAESGSPYERHRCALLG